jgi:hypothetical protein
MTGTDQLERKLHELSEKISKITYRLGRAEKLLERFKDDRDDDRTTNS